MPQILTTNDKKLGLHILPNIIAFLMGLSAAYFLKWDTTDLVWSLWLCSLVIGYFTILCAITGGAYIGFHAIRHKDFPPKYRKPAALAGVGMGLFILGFFSFHFCGFHAGHSVFLKHFFPIEGMPDEGFGEAFMNPPLLWVFVFRYLMAPYWIFLIPVFLVERENIFQPIIKAVNAVRNEDVNVKDLNELRTLTKGGGKQGLMGDAMGRPYVNVVRMHLLIFFFAFCHAVKIDSFVVYAVVYFVYFFPWGEFRIVKNKRDTSI